MSWSKSIDCTVVTLKSSVSCYYVGSHTVLCNSILLESHLWRAAYIWNNWIQTAASDIGCNLMWYILQENFKGMFCHHLTATKCVLFVCLCVCELNLLHVTSSCITHRGYRIGGYWWPVTLWPRLLEMDNAICCINHYPADCVVCFVDTYPLADSVIQPLNNWGLTLLPVILKAKDGLIEFLSFQYTRPHQVYWQLQNQAGFYWPGGGDPERSTERKADCDKSYRSTECSQVQPPIQGHLTVA